MASNGLLLYETGVNTAKSWHYFTKEKENTRAIGSERRRLCAPGCAPDILSQLSAGPPITLLQYFTKHNGLCEDFINGI